MITQQNIAE